MKPFNVFCQSMGFATGERMLLVVCSAKGPEAIPLARILSDTVIYMQKKKCKWHTIYALTHTEQSCTCICMHMHTIQAPTCITHQYADPV
jgi:hypothetical protein